MRFKLKMTIAILAIGLSALVIRSLIVPAVPLPSDSRSRQEPSTLLSAPPGEPAVPAAETKPAATEIKPEPVIALITGGAETDVPWTSRTPAARRVRRINPDPAWMTAVPALKTGDVIELTLFDDAVLSARVSNVTCYPNGAVGLTAHLPEDRGVVFLSYCDGQMRASVEVVGGEDYYVRYNSENREHYAVEVDRKNTMVRECGDIMIPPAQDVRADRPESGHASEAVAPADAPSGSAVVDVMIVYTPVALTIEGNTANMNANIAVAMQRANEAHTNSDTQVYLRLVHSALTTYTESGNDSTDLNRLTNTGDGYMDEIHSLRDSYGADFVCLFSDTATVGGIGWLLTIPAGDSSHAFCLAFIGQTDTGYTVVHEWGHNMGCSHSKTQTVQPWQSTDFRSYSAGWQWSDTKSPYGGYCTVMTYEDANNDGTRDYLRVGHFSNPGIHYAGNSTNVTGHAADGDNARAMREMKSVYPAYRTPRALIVMDETNIILTATAGGSGSVARAVSNAGSGDLTFSVSDDNAGGDYTCRDSRQAGGPVYNWIDISASGTSVSLGDDAESPMLNLGFPFPFYGNSYTQFQIAANGVVSFSPGDVKTLNKALPHTNAPSQSCCIFWDDWDPSASGASVKYHSTSNRLVVSYINVPYSQATNRQTFQMALYPDGRILYQYKTLNGNLASCTVGLMNSNSTGPVVEVAYNTNYLQNSLAVEFRPPQPRWISYTPAGSTVRSGGQTSLLVSASAAALTEGDYYATLTVNHNDVTHSAIQIPVRFQVTGGVADSDSDGLPDWWETLYFGVPANANPAAMASNGINTVRECYVAGINPTNPAAALRVSVVCLPASQTLIGWNAVSGRIYSVYWTTNLLNSFQPLATNMAFPQSVYTDAVNNARRFYKIGVRLAE